MKNIIKKLLREGLNSHLIPVTPNRYLYHSSNPHYRVEILKNGLIPKGKSETWLSDTKIDGKVIFATNSDDKKDWFDSTYDDDIYQIDSMGLNNKWFEDPNFSNDEKSIEYNGKKIILPKTNEINKHVITFEPIPLNNLKLIKKGSGTSLDENNKNIFKNVTFTKINLSTEDIFDMIEYADSFKNLYPNYNDYDNEYEEDYYFGSKEEAYTTINNILSFFNELSNPIPIYRSIKVDSLNDIKYDYLGDSWSYDRESAINFSKNHGCGNVLLIGKTYFENVDWKNTIKLYFLFSNNYDSYDENEINIIDSDEVFDIKIEKIK